MLPFSDELLILAKTYPSPSARYIETSCVAAINRDGIIRRLYPVPFRLIEKGAQFKKWQWVSAKIQKANDDHRPESHRIFIDTITIGKMIATNSNWKDRHPWINRLPDFVCEKAAEAERLSSGRSIALLRPSRLLGLDIQATRSPDWTKEEKTKLLQEFRAGLFDEPGAKQELRQLRKIPYDFYYRYGCNTPEGELEGRHKIIDWEIGALYWNCIKSHGKQWETPFRSKLEGELANKQLLFLMGNIKRFPHQWLIISLIYPPTPLLAGCSQGELF